MAADEPVVQISVTDKEVLKHIVLEYQYLTITERMEVRDTAGVNHKLQNLHSSTLGVFFQSLHVRASSQDL